jgi:hypothetical protein
MFHNHERCVVEVESSCRISRSGPRHEHRHGPEEKVRKQSSTWARPRVERVGVSEREDIACPIGIYSRSYPD